MTFLVCAITLASSPYEKGKGGSGKTSHYIMHTPQGIPCAVRRPMIMRPNVSSVLGRKGSSSRSARPISKPFFYFVGSRGSSTVVARVLFDTKSMGEAVRCLVEDVRMIVRHIRHSRITKQAICSPESSRLLMIRVANVRVDKRALQVAATNVPRKCGGMILSRERTFIISNPRHMRIAQSESGKWLLAGK